MISVNFTNDKKGNLVVPLKNVLDIIEYYQNIIDLAKDYNKKAIRSKNLSNILKGEDKK